MVVMKWRRKVAHIKWKYVEHTGHIVQCQCAQQRILFFSLFLETIQLQLHINSPNPEKKELCIMDFGIHELCTQYFCYSATHIDASIYCSFACNFDIFSCMYGNSMPAFDARWNVDSSIVCASIKSSFNLFGWLFFFLRWKRRRRQRQQPTLQQQQQQL